MFKVLVIDDSAVVRQVVSDILNKAPDIKVIGVANDPIFAKAIMEKDWPDVIVLDIEMPRVDGLTFLRQLMQERPTPVVVLSSLAQEGSATAIEALRLGALHVLAKAKLGIKQQLLDDASSLLAAVYSAAQARVHAAHLITSQSSDIAQQVNVGAMQQTTDKIVLIGASAGGTQALEYVLERLHRTSPPIAIVQHMPEVFTEAFAKRLDQICKIDVREAKANDRLLPGTALIAPGGKHLTIKRSGANYLVDVIAGPRVSRHCPSVDVLFRSGAQCAGANAVGIIMTGMGDDGARGLKEMRDSGATCFAQDEASCVVFGMPKEAIRLGAANAVVSLQQIPGIIENLTYTKSA
ncbi:chemotaxis response regulator protein-glutamate methylesterase [Chitinibacter sp. SCUT-21]|uniref:protein-glutamate methylesterase/protein-glutamine glutaminase n=1 Tax=Chitinibacter sp. SCUT-21 TaxID=2970891 RepID=UPI0035A614C8